MNILETSNALALAQAYDNRTVGEANVRAWHLILADLDAADVMEAIRRHYAADSAWIMPAHIVRLAGEIGQERAKAARQWAPGQYGVPKAEALPQLPREAWLNAEDISPEVVKLLGQLRAALPDTDRARVFPRQAAWEREQRAHQRSAAGEPNPLYKPQSDLADLPAPTAVRGGIKFGKRPAPEDFDRRGWVAEHTDQHVPEGLIVDGCLLCLRRLRDVCRAAGAHDSGTHVGGCPDARPFVTCQTCGARSEDLAAHLRDYPDGSCA